MFSQTFDKFMNKECLNKVFSFGFFGIFFTVFASSSALAAVSANDVASNIVTSSTDLPGLISALSYGIGIALGVFGILKLKGHVENPQQNPIGPAIIRLAVAGALFALPIIYEAAESTIDLAGGATTVPIQDTLKKAPTPPGVGAIAIGTDRVNDIAGNIVASTDQLPGLLAAFAYLLGLLFAVLGLLKIKENVDFAGSQPTVAAASLRAGVIRILAAGALFALPFMFEVLDVTFSAGNSTLSFDNQGIMNQISGLMGTLSGFLPTMVFNDVLNNILLSTNELPGLISVVAYLFGIVIAVAGIIKIKEHVESPDQTPLKEGVVRLMTAGALFALTTIYNAMFDVIGGNGLGIIGTISSAFAGAGLAYSPYFNHLCNPVILPPISIPFTGITIPGIGGGSGLGTIACNIVFNTSTLPAFLTAVAYLIGLVMGLWGIFKIRDHVLNPQQTSVWEGLSRFIAGGLFFALPIIIEVTRNSISPTALLGFAAAPTSGYSGTAVAGCNGLDGILACFMADISGPVHVLLNGFTFVAGIIFVMIGTSRLIKSAQDGARGPGGLGTVMTFAVGGALMSYNQLMRAASSTLTGDLQTKTKGALSYTNGLTGAEVNAAELVVTSVIQFMIIVGLISFIRGLFIVRSVAEGNQQASIMAGITHIVGGALAVNLGPLINAVQTSLGIAQFGITFS